VRTRCGDRSLFLLQISELDIGGLNFFAELSSYHVYTTLNAKNQFRAPTEWGICLRPSGVDSEDETPELKCISCDSERVRSCWLTAMRLAKYGKQLRENYRAFKNKQTESINPKDYNSYTVPNVSTHFVPIFFPSLRGIRSRASF
jgi:hypothetical protein